LADAIDPKKLRSPTLLDTTILVAVARSIAGRKVTAEEQLCSVLFDALVAEKKEIFIAAPTYAEFLRQPHATKLSSHVSTLNVVVFDRLAAKMLGERFPKSALTKFQEPPVNGQPARPPITYIKYDAMIVACALRHGANAVVALDTKLLEMATAVGLYAATPHDFTGRQQVIPGIIASPAHPPKSTPAPPAQET
jgi:predicted nucleic acid-binding protein